MRMKSILGLLGIREKLHRALALLSPLFWCFLFARCSIITSESLDYKDEDEGLDNKVDQFAWVTTESLVHQWFLVKED